MTTMQQPTREAETAASGGGSSQSLRSPVLDRLRLTPFRSLRIPTEATAEEALWRAEETLTLKRANLPIPHADPLPWLPDVDEFEIHQAVQCIEEPLRRLCDQLLWFDFHLDAQADRVAEILADPQGHDADEYLALPTGLAQYANADITWVDDDAADSADAPVMAKVVDSSPDTETSDTGGLLEAVALAANQANLCLTLAAAQLHGRISPPTPEGAQPEGEHLRVNWQARHGLRMATDVHLQIAERVDNGQQLDELRRRWISAAARWRQLLDSPALVVYVRHCIGQLDDELVSGDDVETILGALKAQLTDFLVGEIKLQIIDGRYDRVEVLLKAVAGGGIDRRDWSLAFRPLRQLFDTEIRELETLISERESLRAQDLDIFLTRLQAFNDRWVRLDEEGILGLSHIIDERVQGMHNQLKTYVDLATVEELRPLFRKSRDLAHAASLKQQIDAYLTGIEDTSDWGCFFCQKREVNVDQSVVIRGKKETHREYIGNGYRVYYRIQAAIVPRCSRCCNMHTYFRHACWWFWLALAPALVQFEYYLWHTRREFDWLLWAAGSLGAVVLVGWLTPRIAAALLTPRGEQAYYKCDKSQAYRELVRERYNITIDYTKNALATLRAEH